MKRYIPQIIFLILIIYLIYKILFFIMNIGYSDDHNSMDSSNKAPYTYTDSINLYEELLIGYINSSETFKNDTNKISWRTTEEFFEDSNYQRYQIGYNTELRFWSRQILFINQETKNIYEYDALNDSLIIWKKDN